MELHVAENYDHASENADQIIECVPNFSEGRDLEVIQQITGAIEQVKGVKLLHVDRGEGANRTVVTFAGSPASVVEAAFEGVKKASEVIDMRLHHGEHPRFGATDVLPLVPVRNISLEGTVKYADELAKRIGEELAIPVFCYEASARTETRRSLANCRAGEYEGLAQKLSLPEWQPDFGPAVFNVRSGAVAVGARNFLIAYNVNLNTSNYSYAKAIAADVRESGGISRNPETGKVMTDDNGKPVRIAGTLKKVRAIGWYIDEYKKAQVSMNLIDLSVTPVHTAFEEVSKSAERRGLRVTGSELIGLIPLQSMLDAGKYFLEKQQGTSAGASEEELIGVAVKSLGLDELAPFDPAKRIIEYLLEK